MASRQRRELITADSPEWAAMFGTALAQQVVAITASPEQQAAAREEAERIANDKRLQEAQLLKEICDGADNKVYGKEGQDIAKRFPAGEDGKRDYYMQIGLREALNRAGLLRRSAKRGAKP